MIIKWIWKRVLKNIHFMSLKWHQTPNGDMEWIFMLNRQGYLVDLAVAFYITKEENT